MRRQPGRSWRLFKRANSRTRQTYFSRNIGAHLDITITPAPPRSGGAGRGEEELRRNHWQAQIKSPSPQPSPRASLRGEGVNYGGSGKMRPKHCAHAFRVDNDSSFTLFLSCSTRSMWERNYDY